MKPCANCKKKRSQLQWWLHLSSSCGTGAEAITGHMVYFCTKACASEAWSRMVERAEEGRP